MGSTSTTKVDWDNRKNAWTPEQVPIGSLFRPNGDEKKQGIIVAVAPNLTSIGPALMYEVSMNKFSCYYLGDLATCVYPSYHSVDNGKTWLKCHN